jgi:molybdopterin/thiamine biosynthesis adenylyltransferase
MLNTMRHESVFNPAEHNVPIHIVGAGATGSHVFSSLINLGITNISVYDPDIVSEHNLANQIYTGQDVGRFKVFGCSRYYKEKVGTNTLPDDMRFIAESVTPRSISDYDYCSVGIVFLLVDDMATRSEIFRALVRTKNVFLVIETRMGSTHGNVFTINPFDTDMCRDWQNTLVDDTDEENIELSPCGTTLSVGPTAALIANYAVWQMMQFLVDPIALQPRIDLFFKPTLTVTSTRIAA